MLSSGHSKPGVRGPPKPKSTSAPEAARAAPNAACVRLSAGPRFVNATLRAGPTCGAAPLRHELSLRVKLSSKAPTVTGTNECIGRFGLRRGNAAPGTNALCADFRWAARAWRFHHRSARADFATGGIESVLVHVKRPSRPVFCTRGLASVTIKLEAGSSKPEPGIWATACDSSTYPGNLHCYCN